MGGATHEVPDLPGVLSRAEITESAHHLAGLQTNSGMIPWYPGGHTDPWNHVESAMALDVAGFHGEALAAYRWLADTQRPDGSWHNYYLPDGGRDDTVEKAKLDTNVCAYIGTGIWHHFQSTGDHQAVIELWPTVEQALDFVLRQRRADGLVRWAVRPDSAPWEYALLTGTCSIQHALRAAAAVGLVIDRERPDWVAAADVMCERVETSMDAFEPKERWAMDWYYPVLTGALRGEAAKTRLADGYADFVMDGLGVRCVSDEPWVTASETAEASLAYSAHGDVDTATELLSLTRAHRLDGGAYLTGIVYPDRVVFPAAEHTSYTAAAIILAADAIVGTSPTSHLFTR